jgi:hypothetical protein
MLYKKLPNATGGEYRDKTTLERFDLIDAVNRFYCPNLNCGHTCGDNGSCCFMSDSKDEAIIHFNLEPYDVQ